MTVPEHRHAYTPVIARHDDGTVIPGAQRCHCGATVVGSASGPGAIVLPLDLVIASRRFNLTLGAALTDLAAQCRVFTTSLNDALRAAAEARDSAIREARRDQRG